MPVLHVALLGFAALLPAQVRTAKLAMPSNIEVKPDIVYATYGDKQAFGPIAANLAATGVAAACIEYRVLPDVKFPDPVYDTKAAVRWMRAEGKKYGISSDAIGAIGGSAGGHAGVSSCVQAVAAMAPVVDFAGRMMETLFSDRPELATKLAPVTYVDKDSSPILLIHSTADKAVPIQQSEEMLARCKKAGVPAKMITVGGEAPHGFWMQPQWAADTVKQSAEFFHSVLDKLATGI